MQSVFERRGDQPVRLLVAPQRPGGDLLEDLGGLAWRAATAVLVQDATASRSRSDAQRSSSPRRMNRLVPTVQVARRPALISE